MLLSAQCPSKVLGADMSVFALPPHCMPASWETTQTYWQIAKADCGANLVPSQSRCDSQLPTQDDTAAGAAAMSSAPPLLPRNRPPDSLATDSLLAACCTCEPAKQQLRAPRCGWRAPTALDAHRSSSVAVMGSSRYGSGAFEAFGCCACRGVDGTCYGHVGRDAKGARWGAGPRP